MSTKFPIIYTKLTPPMLRKNLLRRPRLNKRMNEIQEVPLSIFYSGPGYGKSTTLVNYMTDAEVDYCWYTVTKNDDDLVTFVNYLIHAIQTNMPTFCNDFLQRFEDLSTNTIEASHLNVNMINQLMQRKEPLMIIIDDYHLVRHSESINKWLQEFITFLPNHIHLVISTRTKPNWSLMRTFKAKSLLLEVSESDFRFSHDEIEVLFADLYNIYLEPDQIETIYKKTEGWIMAIQMIAQQCSQHSFSDIFQNESDSLEDLFSFLASDVLTKQPLAIQTFLTQACVFEEFNQEMIIEVLKVPQPEHYLKHIIQQNLFLYMVGQQQYRFHALFREFLLQELKQRDADSYFNINKGAADYYLGKGDYDQAISHYEIIEDDHAIERILQTYGLTLLKMGRLDSLQESLFKLKRRLNQVDPILLIYEGEIQRYRCFYHEGAESYHNALTQLEGKQGDMRIPFALEGLARIYLDTIQPAKAAIFLERAIDYITTESEHVPTEQKVSLYRLMAENLINLGRAKEAEQWVKRGQHLSTHFDFKENIEARLYLRTGRLQHAKKLLFTQKEREQEEENHLQLSHRETDLLLSLIYSFEGNADLAKYRAQDGMMQGITYKAPFVEACGWIRLGHAIQLTEHYDLEHADTCYHTALEIMESIHVSRGKAEPLMGLGILCCKKGDFSQARRYAEKALEETESVQDGWLSALIKICMSMIHYYESKVDESMALLDECEQAFDLCGDYYGLSVVYLWKALILYEKKEHLAFNKAMSQLLKNTRTHSYECLLENKTLFGPFDMQNIAPLLLEAEVEPSESDYLSYLLSKLDITKDQVPPGYTLRVQMLSDFRVWQGNQEIQTEDWRRDKAKELFQYLLTNHNQWMPKEAILSTLWPDHDEPSANASLKVALNTLNKVLEPHRKARQKPYYVERRETSYRIEMKSGLDSDVVYFEKYIVRGLEEQKREQAQHWLEKGLAYYKGDFLVERRFEDWCIEERERLLVLFLRGAEKLAQIYVSFEQYIPAIHWCESILKKDSCWEEAYRLLIYCYYQKNNRPQAIKWYQKCVDVLEKELGVEPMPATKEVYQLMIETNMT